ncbi:unnamed protein product [Linum tenue]|uniref:Mitochondrial import inner membrane translocase subunit TIM50 n=1 Tax=Linum tenue TaxID=586396 RepID=A0AAV0JFL1_9ROSI|nr:unnamed protein product [Linum tenue]
MAKKGGDLIKLKALCNSSDDDDEKSVNSDDSEAEDQGGDLPDELLSLGKLSLGPKKKLLVISLGGLLCHKVFKYRENKIRIPRNRQPDADVGTFRIYKRPYCDDFVKFCFERFEVGIWSSSKESNLDDALDCVMGGLKKQLLFTWDQEECTRTGFKCLDNKFKPIFLKDLNQLVESLSAKGTKYLATESLLIDSDPYKSLVNPVSFLLLNTHIIGHSYLNSYVPVVTYDRSYMQPNTSIFPEEYTVSNVSDNELGESPDHYESII